VVARDDDDACDEESRRIAAVKAGEAWARQRRKANPGAATRYRERAICSAPIPWSISALMTANAEAQTTIVAANDDFGTRCTFLYNDEAGEIVRMAP
jgi:hypothetical protein